MAKITANQRQNAIAADQTNINKSWSKLSSDLTRMTLELQAYAAWKNYHFLNGNGDFDSEDIAVLNDQFTTIFRQFSANMALLGEIGAIPNADLTIYQSNNDQYIIDNNIDVADYDKRYQV